jgi:hypothetical protein
LRPQIAIYALIFPTGSVGGNADYALSEEV